MPRPSRVEPGGQEEGDTYYSEDRVERDSPVPDARPGVHQKEFVLARDPARGGADMHAGRGETCCLGPMAQPTAVWRRNLTAANIWLSRR